jgi:hypothetical protein
MDPEVIRQQLVAAGFADVATARVKPGVEDGVPTVEFVKQGGTKGLDAPGLARLLARLPRDRTPLRRKDATGRQQTLVDLLVEGQLTCEQAARQHPDLLAGLQQAVSREHRHDQAKRNQLCARIANLPSVAVEDAGADCVW